MSVVVRRADAADLQRWDARVECFANHRITHTRAWLESLEHVGLGTPLYLMFEKHGTLVGCLPGLLVTRGGIRIFGSPLEGWQSVSMGPAFDPARISTGELMQAAIAWLEREHGVHYVEVMHPGLDEDDMRANGFVGRTVVTYRAALHPEDSQRTFRMMRENARRNVRRGEKLGLVVRFEDDERFVDAHYRQLKMVYRRSGHAVPFTKQRVLACFRYMQRAGKLIAVSVRLPAADVSIATGMFLIQGRELSLWTWAHDPRYRWYRPTELMTWNVMCRAMQAGCTTFDLMGRGEFKAKLGAVPDESKMRWLRARPRVLLAARDLAGASYRLQHAVRGRASRLWGRAVADATVRPRSGLPLACVMGDIDLVRALGLGGIRAVVVAPPGSPTRFSRYTRNVIDWMDPWEKPGELVNALLAFGAAQPEPPVLFYQEDRSLLLVSRYRESLARAFRFTVADPDLVERLVDKSQFQALARELDLPVPPSRTLDPAEECPPQDLEYPLILKPLIRRPDRWEPVAGPGKANRVDTPAALRELWPALQRAGTRVLAQQLVPGPESCIESHHVYVSEKREIIAEFTGRKLRTFPPNFGDSTALEITHAPDVAELGRDIVRRLGLTGVAKLDFKRGPDGRLHLLEINPRFTLWHHPGARAGVNVPQLVFCDLTGRPRPEFGAARAGVRWCKVWRDHAAARVDGVSWLRWMLWVAGCEAKSALAWDDPAPLIGAGLGRWLRRLSPARTNGNGLPVKPATPAPQAWRHG